MHVLLDVSRLIGCARRRTPSGIDRVEAAYVRRWLREPAGSVTFVARSPLRGFAAVPRGLVADLHHCMDVIWSGGGSPAMRAEARRLARRCAIQLALGIGRREATGRLHADRRSALLVVSHRLMEQPEPIARMRRAGAAFIPLIHDLIPATHPEYARPGVAMQHLRRLATVARLADGIIVNSAATAEALRPHLVGQSQDAPVQVAPLGLDLPATVAPSGEAGPYFVAIGTIEPRKNHLLLLHLWRDFAQKFGPAAPRLVIVGRRGWENENVLDILERCTLLRGLVEERGELADHEVVGLLRGARALLFPSFAEGYGLPLAESLACGVPAICSDLPALREVGGTVPEYLDPLDGAGWRRTVMDYATADSRSRPAQLRRMEGWTAPSWDAHFDAVDGLIESILRAPAPVPVWQEPVEPVLASGLRDRPHLRPAPVATGDVPMS